MGKGTAELICLATRACLGPQRLLSSRPGSSLTVSVPLCPRPEFGMDRGEGWLSAAAAFSARLHSGTYLSAALWGWGREQANAQA